MAPILMTIEIETNVKKLIKSLSGFKEKSENFHTCLQFVLSNFRFHRFLDVDSHKVERQIKGICQKLVVHSRGQKADSLQRLFKTFLHSPISRTTQHPKTDVHYGLVSLLVCLANTPTENDYQEKEKAEETEKEPEFDWTSYLLEGLELDDQHLYPDSPEEWSEDDEDNVNQQDTGIEDTSVTKSSCIVTQLNTTLGAGAGDCRNWLEKNVVVQYWNGEVDTTVPNQYVAANVANVWDAYASDVNPIHVAANMRVVTETQLIRETLWILMGSPCSYAYEVKDQILTPRPDIKVSHLTPSRFHESKSILLYTNFFHLQKNIMLSVWLKSIKPYLNIIDTWISQGTLPTHSQEFLIRRNEEVEIDSETFWSEGYILQTRCQNGVDVASSSHSGVPTFLEPIVEQVLLAGKSMQLIEALGKLSGSIRSSQLSIYSDFMESLQQTFGEKFTSSDKQQQMTSEPVQREPWTATCGDIFLHQSFMELFSLEWFKVENSKPKEKVVNISDLNLQPIQLMLHRCLYPFIEVKCQRACQSLMKLFRTDYKLLDFLTSLRKFYLLEAGDTMYDFYSNLFDKLRFNEPWQDLTYLNLQLQEALQAKYPNETNRLTAGVEDVKLTSKKASQPIHALDGLTIHYKVPWPVNLIINPSCLKIYNQIHTFLVQVKRAKYALDQLRPIDLSPSSIHDSDGDDRSSVLLIHTDKSDLFHKMFIMRMNLMHFLNSLHVYLMTRILHGTGLEYQGRLENASDIDEIMRVHQEYMTVIFERCLLHKKVGFVKEAIMKVLNLSVVFQRTWDAGILNLSQERYSKMADELKKCNTFLVTLLTTIVKRGAFPHLEGLALALTYGNDRKDDASEKT
ncbi:gamma-tubulin complex component 5-like [Anneissia japonica]|uniref:gamma-tubulin complex component 5-like n=1 Tax=Anneissia japonica TaxID=1529436 RepID=UPI0014254ED0|nr:gamma-tubulin complex component 5-like [Anneissia japonica]